MAGYHLYKQRNGSGKISRFFSVQFTVAGKVVRRATGERDGAKADVRAAALYLEATSAPTSPSPRRGSTSSGTGS